MSRSAYTLSSVATGAAFGVLTGLLVGMSVSPIVGTVVGPILALVAAVLGLRALPAEKEGEGPSRPWPPPRMGQAGAFAVACVLAVLGGVWLRTHDALSPSLKLQLERLVDAGFTKEQAQQIVLRREMGGVTSTEKSTKGEKGEKGEKDEKSDGGGIERPKASPHDSVLFSERQNLLFALRPNRFGDERSTVEAYKGNAGASKRLAETIEAKVPEGQRAAVLQAAWDFANEK